MKGMSLMVVVSCLAARSAVAQPAATTFHMTADEVAQMQPLVSADGKTLALREVRQGGRQTSTRVVIEVLDGQSEELLISSSGDEATTPPDFLAQQLAALNQRLSDGGFQPAPVATVAKGKATLAGLTIIARQPGHGDGTLTVERGAKPIGSRPLDGVATRVVLLGDHMLYVEVVAHSLAKRDPSAMLTEWRELRLE